MADDEYWEEHVGHLAPREVVETHEPGTCGPTCGHEVLLRKCLPLLKHYAEMTVSWPELSESADELIKAIGECYES